jgi:flavodoxin
VKTLIVCHSYHHGNTKQIADAMAAVLNAKVVNPRDLNTEMLNAYDLIGFGSGIAFGKHYKQIIEVVEKLPHLHKNAFVFSTRGDRRLRFYHRALRRQLEEKGWTVVGEFSCRGYDTYGPNKLVGGIAKGRPNEQDLQAAAEFAQSLSSRRQAE